VFERWGVETLRALAALPVLQLSERLGQEGVRLSELARGVRQRSLVLAQASSTFTEEMELDDAVEELEPLSFLLGRLLDQLCARLEARALAVRAVRIRFELQPSFEKDFQTLKEELRYETGCEAVREGFDIAVPMRNSKTLLKLLRLQLQGDPPAASDPENLHDRGGRRTASDTERLVCAQRARPRKTGSNHRAAGQGWWEKEI